jgi:hypothetical protein
LSRDRRKLLRLLLDDRLESLDNLKKLLLLQPDLLEEGEPLSSS